MSDLKTITLQLESENPNGNGYISSVLRLPADPAEIENAMQKARYYFGENRYTNIYVIEMDMCPEMTRKRFDSASIQEYNTLAKELASLEESHDKAIFRALANKLFPVDDDELVTVRDLMYAAEHVSDIAVASNVTNDEELGELVFEYGMNDKLESIHDAEILDMLSRKAVGEWQRKNDEGVFVDDYYVVTEGFQVPDDYEMPTAEEEPYAPIYVKLGAFVDMDGSEPNAEWFPLPIAEERKATVAEKIKAIDFGYAEVFAVRSAIPYVDEDILSGGDLDDLNTLASMYLKMDDMERITFKAAAEAAEPKYMSDIMDIAEHVGEYRLDYFSEDEDDFFKEYIGRHLDPGIDRRWLESLLSGNEGMRLIKAMNASMTSYGVVSERGGLLFEPVPYDYDMSIGIQLQPGEYDLIEVCGHKGLYVDNREDALRVPSNCYRYDFRSAEDNEFATLEKDVLVDYSGSVFVKETIDIPEEGYLKLSEEESPNFLSEVMTIQEFAEADLSQFDEDEGMGGIS